MEEMGWLVDMRATRGVSVEDDGRAGEEVGMKRGVELRAGGDDGVPRWEDIVGYRETAVDDVHGEEMVGDGTRHASQLQPDSSTRLMT